MTIPWTREISYPVSRILDPFTSVVLSRRVHADHFDSSIPYGACPPYNQYSEPNRGQSDGRDFQGERLTVQFARGSRHKETFNGPPTRDGPPRPRRTIYRMNITGLPTDTSWQVSILHFSHVFPSLLSFENMTSAKLVHTTIHAWGAGLDWSCVNLDSPQIEVHLKDAR